MSFFFKVLWVKCQYLSLQQRKKPLRREMTNEFLSISVLLNFSFSFFFFFPSLSHELTTSLFLILKRKGYPLALITFFRSLWSLCKISHASAFCSENLKWSCTRKEPYALQGHSDVPWHFLMEKIQKLSVHLLNARHVLGKKVQQSFLSISLIIFTFPIQLEEIGRIFKSLDPHFVPLHTTVFSFSLNSVLFFFFVSALFAEGTKLII